MLLWVVFAVLTVITAVIVVSPYWRGPRVTTGQAQDVAVYKQQLTEIDEEFARGLLGDAEAQAARIEISRRILAASENSQGAVATRTSSFAPYLIVGFVAILTVGTYLIYGSPNLPDEPLAARLGPNGGQSIEALIARVEQRLRAHPEDAEGWRVISHIYMRLGRYADAVHAYKQTIELLGSTTERLGDLGEALTLENGGVVTSEARDAFTKVLAAEPEDDRAQFWLAVAVEQSGDLKEAANCYRRLLERKLPDDVQNVVRQRLADIDTQAAGKQPSEAGQAEMINRMVSGLAERLKADGSDLEGWLKLMRAYSVLGRRDDALGALKQAQSQFAGNQEALGRIEEMAKSLGLSS